MAHNGFPQSISVHDVFLPFVKVDYGTKASFCLIRYFHKRTLLCMCSVAPLSFGVNSAPASFMRVTSATIFRSLMRLLSQTYGWPLGPVLRLTLQTCALLCIWECERARVQGNSVQMKVCLSWVGLQLLLHRKSLTMPSHSTGHCVFLESSACCGSHQPHLCTDTHSQGNGIRDL
jgi:hypothetical protein